jgi:hypothetical protein
MRGKDIVGAAGGDRNALIEIAHDIDSRHRPAIDPEKSRLLSGPASEVDPKRLVWGVRAPLKLLHAPVFSSNA